MKKNNTDFPVMVVILAALFLSFSQTGFSNPNLPDTRNTEEYRNERMNEKIDSEIMSVLNILPGIFAKTTLDSTNIAEYRSVAAELGKLAVSEHYKFATISSQQIKADEHEIQIYIYDPVERSENPTPALLWIHGGGFVSGTGRDDAYLIPYVKELNIPVISFDYRLLPEHPFPAALEDTYTVWNWLLQIAESKNIDTSRICLAGASGGGTLAAGLVILNQERNTPQPAFLQLRYPMLDDTHNTESGRKNDYYIWDRQTSFNIWKLYLAGNKATSLAAPARAEVLSFFPPTYMQICEVDLFRDEDLIFAERLKQSGVKIEYDVFPGMVHAGEVLAPDAEICQKINKILFNTIKKELDLK